MDTVQSTDIEILNNPQDQDSQTENLTEEKEAISQELSPQTDGNSTTEGEQTETTGENQETPESDTPAEEVKTPEQIAEEEAKKLEEQRIKSERAKLAKLEAENYNLKLSKTVENEFRQDPEKATVNLIKDKNKFERVAPILAQDNPAWRNSNGEPLSYQEFVTLVKQVTSETAKEDPKALQTYSQVEQANQEAIFKAQQEEQAIFNQVKYDLMLDMPEFLAKARNPQTAQLAEGDLVEALNLAGARISRIRQAGGEEPDAMELTKQYLRNLNPEWGNTKNISNSTKTQVKNEVKNMLKESVSSTSSQSTSVTNFTSQQQESREAFINFLVNDCGNSKEEAVAKANQTTF